MENCASVGIEQRHHFAEVGQMVSIGSGAEREQKDYVLSRVACYFVALNGEASKQEIAWAKAYFVAQTKMREAEALPNSASERLRLREKLKAANKALSSVAKQAGVENYAFFNDAGIRGLYGMKMSDLKAKKGIEKSEDYWDRAGGLELSANEFKAQLAAETIGKRKIRGQKPAEIEHERVGRIVRKTIEDETQISPENLPTEPSLKKIISSEKKRLAKSLTKELALNSPTEPPPPE